MHQPVMKTTLIAALLFTLVVPVAPAAPAQEIIFYVH
jgi:hypothetical protein